MDVGFVGLGKMGRPMVERLLGASHVVHVFNRSRPAMDALAARGAQPAASAAAVAVRAELILTALPTSASVEEVFGQFAAVAHEGQIYADHSTVSPELNRRCAELLTARGADFLDAPVSGGPAGAQAGTLTVMVGGEEIVFQRAEPVFRAFGQNVRLCGPVGAGQVIKLANQLLVAIHTAAIAEAAVFATKLGADPQLMLDLLGTSFGSSAMLTRNLPRFMAQDYRPATPVSLILKDLGVIQGEAERGGVPLWLGTRTLAQFREAAELGLADEDMAALVRLWEQAADHTVAQSNSGTP
ncbi:MAG: 2-hydroxy-3-oxopropionate reductase [Chloroflexota bacterium]|jgi:3-hydroxyisobutyrate dehydrogenase/2-hydroxy-3-oxopropionate reductase|nr:2-hydroxy-3-oxopropionate reductase [Chloroflexota bacterium]